MKLIVILLIAVIVGALLEYYVEPYVIQVMRQEIFKCD